MCGMARSGFDAQKTLTRQKSTASVPLNPARVSEQTGINQRQARPLDGHVQVAKQPANRQQVRPQQFHNGPALFGDASARRQFGDEDDTQAVAGVAAAGTEQVAECGATAFAGVVP